MTLDEYQQKAMETCLPESENELYMLMEIAEECGELQGKFSKAIRHGAIKFVDNKLASNMSEEEYVDWLVSVLKEIGDIMWGIAGLATVLSVPLGSIAQSNLNKLASRKKRNVIDGAGDNR